MSVQVREATQACLRLAFIYRIVFKGINKNWHELRFSFCKSRRVGFFFQIDDTATECSFRA